MKSINSSYFYKNNNIMNKQNNFQINIKYIFTKLMKLSN